MCVWVLVGRSGHDEMHRAFSFTDGGDGFGVGHAGHEFLIHLQETSQRLTHVRKKDKACRINAQQIERFAFVLFCLCTVHRVGRGHSK